MMALCARQKKLIEFEFATVLGIEENEAEGFIKANM